MFAHVMTLALAVSTPSPTADPAPAKVGAEPARPGELDRSARPPVDVLPFIEDDYPAALARARTRKVPLFIDAWAPWCHTCRSMRAYVFTDPALAPHAARFVWLSLDTENAKNAAIRGKLGIS